MSGCELAVVERPESDEEATSEADVVLEPTDVDEADD